MKKSQLKAIVKEIVRTYEKMSQDSTNMASWSLEGSTLYVEDLDLPDGKSIGAELDINGYWDDGAFEHEFGTHRYPAQFVIEQIKIIKVWEMGTDQAISLTDDIEAIIDSYVESVSDDISEKMGDD